ncbi:MAG: TetR/AcrR family transcriptional regulator [Firmicutes bacterium]|nr:TetR/AcrR family transcriptional regulator [Bacillota bacterium]
MNEKSFERQEELIEAALDEFSTKSYDEASLNRIIRNAGISKGTFYYHFSDKQALYLYVLQHGLQAKWQFINEATQNATETHGSKDIFEVFKWQARLGVQFAKAFPKYHQLTKMFVKEKGSEIHEVARASLGKDAELSLEALIDLAMEQGVFREAFSREFMIRVISHLFASFHDLFGDEDDLEVDQMLRNLDAYVDFMKYGLKRGAHGR